MLIWSLYNLKKKKKNENNNGSHYNQLPVLFTSFLEKETEKMIEEYI